MSLKSKSATPSGSRSQSPFVDSFEPDQHEDESNGVEPSPKSASSSKMTPTPPPATFSTSRKRQPLPVQLIGDLPIARDEALASFIEMPDNWYQYKSLGRSRELMESMTCECQFSPGDDPDSACGQDCINRLTQVECLPDDCRCGKFCQNQRFQKKDYAPIEIVKTEMKGYGLRVEQTIEKDTFIYEYVGDVVNTPSFKKRMRDYANEGIQHFYFMMLQKDEFIDATKNGGIGRFANHSCNPNCYVAKWTIGRTVRMGIFSKRKIQKYEELTFNYNVDRYGHQAQTCYCGEPNCVGFIGGKTQTDVSSMDDLYLDALGITDEDELMELKGTKKKKGKKIDDPDFMPQMRSLVEKEVPKVVQALRQVQSKKVLFKLLTRIKITEDASSLRQVMRLRGFSIMKNILDDFAEDLEIVALALQCMWTWPLVVRNKVEDSQMLETVEALQESEDAAVKEEASKLHEKWQSLELAYRIPKRTQQEIEAAQEIEARHAMFGSTVSSIEPKRPRFVDADINGNPIKTHRQPRKRPFGYSYTAPVYKASPVPVIPPTPPALPAPEVERGPSKTEKSRMQSEAVLNLIASVVEEKAAAEAAAAEQARLDAVKAEAEAKAKSAAMKDPSQKTESKRKAKEKKKSTQSEAEKETNKEKRLQKLVGAVVVKCMSKYAKSSLDHEQFKKYAKELTEKIAEREKKSASYKEGKLETLSEEKTAKIKKYAKEYINNKILRKINKDKSGHGSRPIKQEAPSDGTPNSAGLPSTMADLEMVGDIDVDMGDVGDDSGSEDLDDGKDDVHMEVDSPVKREEFDSPIKRELSESDPWRSDVRVGI